MGSKRPWLARSRDYLAPFNQLTEVIVVLVIRGDRQAQPGAQPRIPLRQYGGHLPVGALGDNTVHDLVGEVFGQVAPFGAACHVPECFADRPEPEVFQLATVGRRAVTESELSA